MRKDTFEQLGRGTYGGQRTTLKDRVLGLGSLATVGALLGYSALNGPEEPVNLPETYIGFGEYNEEGYWAEDVKIPTRGDITEVELIPNVIYDKKVLENGDLLTLTGPFDYKISPDYDTREKDPEKFKDRREGIVYLRKENH